MRKFNEFLNEISLYVNIILEYIHYYIMIIINTCKAEYEFIPVQSINLNNTNLPLILFKLKEINYDNIKAIVIDSFHNESNGYRYMRIYNHKGQLIINLGWLIETVEHDDNLIELTDMIKDHCNAYMNKTKPWWWVWDEAFYMHITNNNIYNEI